MRHPGVLRGQGDPMTGRHTGTGTATCPVDGGGKRTRTLIESKARQERRVSLQSLELSPPLPVSTPCPASATRLHPLQAQAFPAASSWGPWPSRGGILPGSQPHLPTSRCDTILFSPSAMQRVGEWWRGFLIPISQMGKLRIREARISLELQVTK